MAAFHDNFDAWNSKYQPWNTVRVGPSGTFIGLGGAAARKEGLPFGVTYHVSPGRVWRQFMPVRFTSDKQGPQAGVPYDALGLTKADGKGTWWEGLDPRDFYGPPHAAEAPARNSSSSSCFAWTTWFANTTPTCSTSTTA